MIHAIKAFVLEIVKSVIVIAVAIIVITLLKY